MVLFAALFAALMALVMLFHQPFEPFVMLFTCHYYSASF